LPIRPSSDLPKYAGFPVKPFRASRCGAARRASKIRKIEDDKRLAQIEPY